MGELSTDSNKIGKFPSRQVECNQHHQQRHDKTAHNFHVRHLEIINARKQQSRSSGKAEQSKSRARNKIPVNESIDEAQEQDGGKHPGRTEIDIAFRYVAEANRGALLRT